MWFARIILLLCVLPALGHAADCSLKPPRPTLVQIDYKGGCQGGFAHGRGVALYQVTDQTKDDVIRHEGEFVNGVANGQTTYSSQSGKFGFQGEFRNWRPYEGVAFQPSGFGRILEVTYRSGDIASKEHKNRDGGTPPPQVAQQQATGPNPLAMLLERALTKKITQRPQQPVDSIRQQAADADAAIRQQSQAANAYIANQVREADAQSRANIAAADAQSKANIAKWDAQANANLAKWNAQATANLAQQTQAAAANIANQVREADVRSRADIAAAEAQSKANLAKWNAQANANIARSDAQATANLAQQSQAATANTANQVREADVRMAAQIRAADAQSKANTAIWDAQAKARRDVESVEAKAAIERQAANATASVREQVQTSDARMAAQTRDIEEQRKRQEAAIKIPAIDTTSGTLPRAVPSTNSNELFVAKPEQRAQASQTAKALAPAASLNANSSGHTVPPTVSQPEIGTRGQINSFLSKSSSSGLNTANSTQALTPGQLSRDPQNAQRELDATQTALSLAGITPIGPLADVPNAAISLLRGNYKDAAFNAVSAIPGPGDAFAAGLLVRRAARFEKEGIDTVAKISEKSPTPYEVSDEYRKLTKGDVVGDGLENHHLPQKSVAKKIVEGYPQDKNALTAPAIRLPEAQHIAITRLQTLNAEMRAKMTPTQLLADDARMLRDVGVPENSILQILLINKIKYGIPP